MLLYLTFFAFGLVICITYVIITGSSGKNQNLRDFFWDNLKMYICKTMKRNVLNRNVNKQPSYRDYGSDRTETKPRLELAPFVGLRRLFVGTFLYSRQHRDPVTGRYYRNGKFGNIYDLVTGTPIATQKGTNSDHLWIEGRHWLSDWRLADIPKMQKVSFTGEVATYTTPEKNYTDYRATKVSDVLDWDRYDRNMDILADYDAGCPDIPHWTPDYSTVIPGQMGRDDDYSLENDQLPE